LVKVKHLCIKLSPTDDWKFDIQDLKKDFESWKVYKGSKIMNFNRKLETLDTPPTLKISHKNIPKEAYKNANTFRYVFLTQARARIWHILFFTVLLTFFLSLYDFSKFNLENDGGETGKTTQFHKSMIIFNVVLVIKNKHIEEMIKSINDVLNDPKDTIFEEVGYHTIFFNFLRNLENPSWYAFEISIVWCLSYILRKTVLVVGIPEEERTKKHLHAMKLPEKVCHYGFWLCILINLKIGYYGGF
jgi:hypothetical protein